MARYHRDAHRIRIEEKKFGSLLAGQASRLPTVPGQVMRRDKAMWLVQLNSDHCESDRFGKLAHELGHIFAGHCGADEKGRWPDRSALSYPEKEVEEAEAVSFLVCARRDLKTASDQYLRSLISKADFRNISLYAIICADNRVEARA